MTSFISQYLRNQWLIFSDSKCSLLRKGNTLTLPKRFIKICPLFITWKSANFLYPPSQQERERDDSHKILKMGSLHWVIILCNEIKNSDLLQRYTCKSGQTIFLLSKCKLAWFLMWTLLIVACLVSVGELAWFLMWTLLTVAFLVSEGTLTGQKDCLYTFASITL